jgi:hypothetical protein
MQPARQRSIVQRRPGALAALKGPPPKFCKSGSAQDEPDNEPLCEKNMDESRVYTHYECVLPQRAFKTRHWRKYMTHAELVSTAARERTIATFASEDCYMHAAYITGIL